MMPDFELLFTCMFIIGGGLYWMLRMARAILDEAPM